MAMVWWWAILCLSTLAVLYPYLLYPLLLAVMGRRSEKRKDPVKWPKAAILVSAFNEESRIGDKLRNFQAILYPGELELWIGCDGANDRTADVIRAAAIAGVHLQAHAERRGKTAVLNDLAAAARQNGAEVFLFTDVNAFYRPDAVTELVRMLWADPETGLVSGRTVILGADGNAEVEGAYYRLESWLKEREGMFGCLPGADGAIYAMRASLYTPLENALINDLAHPCQVVAQGHTARFAPEAVSEEGAGEGTEREFHRQTRMTAQAAYVLASSSPALVRAGQWRMLFVLASHKWARWTAGIWMLTAGIAWIVLTGWVGALALVAAIGLVALAAKFNLPGSGILVFFTVVHAAYLRGLAKALEGERYVTWKPRAG
ncbi:hypothetical protein F183_A55130 (plasmid) [Bryobacterales bacterium F-183]|nr:hypothetical protein F183_A55130 [Bryobacterales bacterium F-183]